MPRTDLAPFVDLRVDELRSQLQDALAVSRVVGPVVGAVDALNRVRKRLLELAAPQYRT